MLVENIYILFGSYSPLNISELKRRYYNLSKVFHPDYYKVGENTYENEMFINISFSYNLLINKSFKKIYDKIIVEQNENIDILKVRNSKFIDYLDSGFIGVNDKLKLAELDLIKNFGLKKYKLLLYHFLKISPKYSLDLIKKISIKKNLGFNSLYYDILFEILLNHDRYFEKFIFFFKELDIEEDSDKNILNLCIDYINNQIDNYKFKELIMTYNSRLLHLLAIKMLT